MTAMLIAGLALGGVCAYVWSLIVRAEGQADAAEVGESSGPQAMTTPAPSRVALVRDVLPRLRQLRPWRRSRLTVEWAVAALVTATAQARARLRERRGARDRDALEFGARRPRFYEAMEVTGTGMDTGAFADAAPSRWQRQPSRLIAAVELILLILVVAAALAAGVLGAAHVIAGHVAVHVGG